MILRLPHSLCPIRRRATLALLSVALLVLMPSPSASEEAPAESESFLLDMAMVEASLGQVNPTEAIAAFETYAKVYAETVGVNAIVEATAFRDLQGLLESARKGNQKILGLQVQDYLYLKEHVPLDLMFLAERSGRATETYVVLVRDDSEFTELSDLRGRSLLTCRGQQMGLAEMWLDCRLSDEGLPCCKGFFDNVEVREKMSRALLPVFFGRADACLVAESGFETMAELNPQIEAMLRPLASSPPVITFVTCIRSDFTGPNRERSEKAYLEAHLHPLGRQCLTLFKFDKMRPCSDADLESALDIIHRHGQLTHSLNTPP